jgi:DGQHR domain-containing protein
MKFKVLEVSQPGGTFYLAAIPARFLISHCRPNARQYDSGLREAFGIQRELNKKRVRDVQRYTEDPDSIFPTPIIISVSSDSCDLKDDSTILINEESFTAEIIDGQHRVAGISQSSRVDDFVLPAAIMFDLTEREKAYIFSTINSNQQKVDPSLIYDLFAVTDERSPFKTAHTLARSFNFDLNSPLSGRLKLLGRKSSETETISQGMFVEYLLPLLSNDPQKDLIDSKKGIKSNDDPGCPFRANYINDEDSFIYKVLSNYFTAFRDVFPDEWDNPSKYILTRSTGFGALMLALRNLVAEGVTQRNLSYDYFRTIADNLSISLLRRGEKLTSGYFPSNLQQQRRLARLIEGMPDDEKSQCSLDAVVLLKQAAQDIRGSVLLVTTYEGVTIQSNGQVFSDGSNPRESARWRGALSELIDCGFLRQTDSNGNVFSMTEKGYGFLEGA